MEIFRIFILLIISFFGVYIAIPYIIRIALSGGFIDLPDGLRKVHGEKIPNLGGIGIFTGFLFACILFLKNTTLPYSHFLLAASFILFLTGVVDDLVGLTPYKKVLVQIVAAFIVVYFSHVQLTSFYGLFGVFNIPSLLGIPFSILTIIVITNAFNLIDGVDGLAASIGTMVCITFGVIFFMMDEVGWSRVSFALAGALLGFLKYNFSPAKIFMGDTGAYLIGFIVSVITLKFIELNKFDGVFNPDPFVRSAPAVAIGILVIPLFDTLRVFVIRALKGGSPFSGDRNHLHHVLLRIGLNHTQITVFFILINVFFIVSCLFLQDIGSTELMLLILLIASLMNFILYLYARKKS